MQLTISVIIPTLNRKADTINCISHLLQAASVAHSEPEIIVVDNGSVDGTCTEIRQQFGDRIIVAENAQLSIGALRNLGASLSHGEVLCFIDSDCLVKVDYFSELQRVFTDTTIGMAGAMYGLPTHAHWIEASWLHLNHPTREGRAKLLPGGSMAVRKREFDKIGGFDRSLITGEDADLCERLILNGVVVWETPRLQVTHLRNTTSLLVFFRRQTWYGLDGLRRLREFRIDRITAISLIYVILGALSLVLVILSPGELRSWIICFMTLLGLPAMAVLFRVRNKGKVDTLVGVITLFAIYFLARSYGAVRGFIRRPS